MKKLRNKVFSVICIILTTFLLSILIIFNYQNYTQRAEAVKANLMKMSSSKRHFGNKNEENSESKQEKEPKIFMDSTVYTVLLNDSLEIKDVINHTTKDISDETIEKIAEKILRNKKIEKIKVGNLYFDDYSYAFNKNNTALVIIDNSNIKEILIQTIRTSIFIFIVLELIIVIISKQITSWIIKPVIETFDKQKQFIADASHELKTPLSVILASSEALEHEPEEKKWLENIKSESERMSNLVSNLLDMAKSENEVREEYIKEDLSKIVEKSVLTFESLIYEKDIELKYDIEKNIELSCNKDQIKQVVGILIDNAIRHSCSKGEIKLRLKKEKENIVLLVSNKGIEIPKEEQEKIFERFYRADESRNRNENRYGLGLAIAKNIVTNHNGKISVNSENGYTTFKVVFCNTSVCKNI